MKTWVTRQQLGLLAYLAQTVDAAAPQRRPILDAVRTSLIGNPEWSLKEQDRRLQLLPPGTLLMLERMQYRSRAHDPEIVRACQEAATISSLLLPSSTQVSQERTLLRLAQTWASHALSGSVNARWLGRIGQDYFKGQWKQWNQAASQLDPHPLEEPLDILRDPWAATEDRCLDIATLLGALPSNPPVVLAQIENYLFHHQFFWPLVVFAGHAISLPVGVDVAFNPKPQEASLRLLGADGVIALEHWEKRARKWVDVGKKLWRSKHGNHGDFRDLVMSNRTVVTFDFRYAQELAAPLVDCGFTGHTLPVCDSSADAFFAQAVLHRLLGRTTMHGAAASGEIGPQRHDGHGKDVLNWNYCSPKALRSKLHYVFASQMFERMVVPTDSQEVVDEYIANTVYGSDEPTGRLAPPSTEIIPVPHLQRMADAFQVHGWRQFSYVRCPEIAWGIHAEGNPRFVDPESGAPDAKAVQAVLRSLAKQESAVIKLDADPQHVASALWHINVRERERMNRPPAMLSWAFVRVCEYERDAEFWYTLWHVMGASTADFRRLLKANSWEESAGCIADALNVFEPKQEKPTHRAPDLLVIVGCELLEEQRSRTLTPRSREFLVSPILEILAQRKHLIGPYDDRLQRFIGKTRIIIVPESAIPDPIPLLGFTSSEKAALRALSVFEHSFTQNMAALLLKSEFGFQGREVRRLLQVLEAKGATKRSPIGHHYVVPAVRVGMLKGYDDDRRLALRHLGAGYSLAPYVTSADFPSLAMDVARSPEFVHEAGYHFDRAQRAAKRAHDRQLYSQCALAFKEHTRLTHLATWDSVNSFSKAQGLEFYAWDMASELIRWKQEGPSPVHPWHYVLAARAAVRKGKRLGTPMSPEAGALFKEAEEYFKLALKSCTAFPSEKEWLELLVISYYGEFLLGIDPDQAIAMANSIGNQEVMVVPKGTGPALSGRLFEAAGDIERNDAKAAECYVMGTRLAPEWQQLWIKAIGAARLVDQKQLLLELFSRIETKEVVRILTQSREAFHRRKEAEQFVIKRWDCGIEAFSNKWGHNTDIANALRDLREHHW